MKKKLTKICAALCIAALLSGFTAAPASAEGAVYGAELGSSPVARVKDARAVEQEYTLSTVPSKSVYTYPPRDVYFGSQNLGAIGRVINGEVYLPIR